MMLNVTDYGAVGDGKALNTAAIQKAVDDCSIGGGGTVFIPNGRYLTGTIFMKSHVTLHLEVNAALLGSRRQEDYPTDSSLVHKQRYDLEPHMNTALIYCQDCVDIGFEGPGTIHGNGQEWEGFYRPMMLRFLRCENIRMTDIRLRNPGSWCTAFLECRNIFVRGVDIVTVNNGNGDGLDFDSCRNVVVSDCILNCSDDCICLQNSVRGSICGNITITNCIMTGKWAGCRFGLLSVGGFEDITVSNCVIHDVDCSGFKIQMCEGAVLRNVLVENITMRNVPRPLMITLNHYGFHVDGDGSPPETGVLTGLKFNNIIIGSDQSKGYLENSGIVIQGSPGFEISNIELNNIDYTVYGADDAAPLPLGGIPDMVGKRPEFFVWDGLLPSYGLYLNHVKEISIRNMKLRCLHPSRKAAVAISEATDVLIDGLRFSDSIGVPGVISDHVRELDIMNVRLFVESDTVCPS
jgi:polygalacturonase